MKEVKFSWVKENSGAAWQTLPNERRNDEPRYNYGKTEKSSCHLQYKNAQRAWHQEKLKNNLGFCVVKFQQTQKLNSCMQVFRLVLVDAKPDGCCFTTFQLQLTQHFPCSQRFKKFLPCCGTRRREICTFCKKDNKSKVLSVHREPWGVHVRISACGNQSTVLHSALPCEKAVTGEPCSHSRLDISLKREITQPDEASTWAELDLLPEDQDREQCAWENRCPRICSEHCTRPSAFCARVRITVFAKRKPFLNSFCAMFGVPLPGQFGTAAMVQAAGLKSALTSTTDQCGHFESREPSHYFCNKPLKNIMKGKYAITCVNEIFPAPI